MFLPGGLNAAPIESRPESQSRREAFDKSCFNIEGAEEGEVAVGKKHDVVDHEPLKHVTQSVIRARTVAPCEHDAPWSIHARRRWGESPPRASSSGEPLILAAALETVTCSVPLAPAGTRRKRAGTRHKGQARTIIEIRG
jgi:hypothetical protein